MIKFIKYQLCFAIFLAVGFFSVAQAGFSQCDQNYPIRTIRYQANKHFFDTFSNNGTRTVFLNDFFVDFFNPTYLDSGSPFEWTSMINNAGYAINPGITTEIIATDSTRNPAPITGWKIVQHPVTRSTGSNYDFGIRYKIIYDYSNNYPNTSDDQSHTECQYYQVTWC